MVPGSTRYFTVYIPCHLMRDIFVIWKGVVKMIYIIP